METELPATLLESESKNEVIISILEFPSNPNSTKIGINNISSTNNIGNKATSLANSLLKITGDNKQKWNNNRP
jgi:hypothetical protein